MKRLKTVNEYYLYFSQGNCFAPFFDDLPGDLKLYWENQFIEYKNQLN